MFEFVFSQNSSFGLKMKRLVPMDDASDVHGWVSDAAKVLDIEERRALNAVCETLRDSNVEAVQLKV